MSKRDRDVSISSSDLESLFMSSDSESAARKKKKKEKKEKKDKYKGEKKKSRTERKFGDVVTVDTTAGSSSSVPPPAYGSVVGPAIPPVLDAAAVEAARVRSAEEEKKRVAAAEAAYEAARIAREAAEEEEWKKEVAQEANRKKDVQAALEAAVAASINEGHISAPAPATSFLKSHVAEVGEENGDFMMSSSDDEGGDDDLLSLMTVEIKRESKAELEAIEKQKREAALRGLLTAVKASEKQQAAAAVDEEAGRLDRVTGALVLSPAEAGASTAVAVFAEDEAAATDNRHGNKRTLEHSKVTEKIKVLSRVDHSSIRYAPFEKDFFIAPPESARLTEQEVVQLRKELDGAVARGEDMPPPIRSWVGIGLPQKTLEYLQRKGFERPLAIQSVAIPILMSGRDLLAIAKTGSGKTLSYTIPLVRHVLNQPRCGPREGPIGLILVPTRELSAQVFEVVKEVAIASSNTNNTNTNTNQHHSGRDHSTLKVGASFGGSTMIDNIKECTAGTDIMVATPGRLLDLLTVSGKVLSLRRCTFVIVDEVDRMLDAAFKEHTEAFLRNVRPDRQVALLSGTLPDSIKGFGRRMLHPNHIEVVVGGRPSPSTNVKQSFVVFEEEAYEPDPLKQKPDRRVEHLLRLLSEEVMRKKVVTSAASGAVLTDHEALIAQSKGEAIVTRFPLVLIFVHSVQDCDMLYGKLSTSGYGHMTGLLHRDMEPIDRQGAVTRFNPSDRCILIATGAAERGLDISGLELVVNYWMPTHFEAYIHRVGRTGRAGKMGRAVSFYTKEKDSMLAEQLVKSLADQEDAGTRLPDEIRQDAKAVEEKRKAGLLKGASGYKQGYGSAKGFSFSNKEAKKKNMEDLKACGLGDYLSEDEDEDGVDGGGGVDGGDDEVDLYVNSFGESIIKEVPAEAEGGGDDEGASSSTALVLGGGSKAGALSLVSSSRNQDLQARAAAARSFAEKSTAMFQQPETRSNMYTCDFKINDMARHIRNALIKSSLLQELQEKHNVTITKKGIHVDPKARRTHKMKEGERELYLEIRGRYRDDLQEVLRGLDDAKRAAIAKARMSDSGLGHKVVFEE